MGLFSAIQRGLQAAQEKAESEAAPLIQLIEYRDLSGGADALCRRLGSLSFIVAFPRVPGRRQVVLV